MSRMMIDAEIYGMMFRAKMAMRLIVPPEKHVAGRSRPASAAEHVLGERVRIDAAVDRRAELHDESAKREPDALQLWPWERPEIEIPEQASSCRCQHIRLLRL